MSPISSLHAFPSMCTAQMMHNLQVCILFTHPLFYSSWGSYLIYFVPWNLLVVHALLPHNGMRQHLRGIKRQRFDTLIPNGSLANKWTLFTPGPPRMATMSSMIMIMIPYPTCPSLSIFFSILIFNAEKKCSECVLKITWKSIVTTHSERPGASLRSM